MSYQDLATQLALRYGINPSLFSNLVKQESGWNPTAVSPKGAIGLTQAMPATARDPGFGVTPLSDPYDPQESLRFGAEYLSAMLNRYKGDVPRALAAYNWGAGNADRWDGDMASLPEETRNYIKSITGGQMIHGSTKGQGLPPEEMIVKRDLQGQIPPDELARITGNAILKSQQAQFAEASAPPPSPAALDAANAGVLTEDAPVVDNSGFLGRLMPNMTEDQRQARLLAIGAGLLSGEDWSSGLAAAGQNLMGVVQGESQEQAAIRRMALEEAMNQQATRPESFRPVGTVQLPDGTQVGGAFADPNTGTFFTINPDGTRQELYGAMPMNNSDASGSRYTNQIFKERDAASEAAGTLRTVDRVLGKLDQTPTGISGAISDLQRAFNTIVGQGITPEQMARGLSQAEIQGLIGKFKDEVVGGGVMTEQDAARIVISLGGDLQSIFTNPDILRERLSTLRGDAERRYLRHYEQYELFRTMYPNMPLMPLERYTGPQPPEAQNLGKGALDSSNVASPASPPPSGWTAEEWSVLTDEERASLSSPSSTTTNTGRTEAVDIMKMPAPKGIQPALWGVMTAEERKEWLELNK